LSCKILSKK